MKSIERFADLLNYSTISEWRNKVFRLGNDFGYEKVLLAIFPDCNSPMEAEYAFLHSNYSSDWRKRYDENKLGHVDPTVSHCLSKSTPLIWTPGIFSAEKQKNMYEEACKYGLRSGVTLPIHGARGEFGVLCFVSDIEPTQHFQHRVIHSLAELSCLRDYIFESSFRFIKKICPANERVSITTRELECLKWSASGKNSWEIGELLNCTEATVNFHFSNIRRKFETKSRQQAIVRAIKLGIIDPI